MRMKVLRTRVRRRGFSCGGSFESHRCGALVTVRPAGYPHSLSQWVGTQVRQVSEASNPVLQVLSARVIVGAGV